MDPPAAAAPARPSIWPVFVAPLVVLVVTFMAASLAAQVFIVSWDLPPDTPRAETAAKLTTSPSFLLCSIILTAGSLLFVTWLVWMISGAPLRDFLRSGPGARPALRTALFAVMCLGSGIAVSNLTALATGTPSSVVTSMQQMLGSSGRSLLVAQVITFVVLSPVAEELFFRGFIQTRLRARWGRVPAIATSALLFGAFHLEPKHALAATVIGLALGWSVEASGSVRTSIICHVFNNLIAVLPWAAGSLVSSTPTRNHRVIATLAWTVVCAGCAWLVMRRYGRRFSS